MADLDRATLLVAGMVLSGCGAIIPNPYHRNKSVEIQREQATRFQRQHPEADACIKRNAGTFTQSYPGQLKELCLSVEEKP